MKINWKLTGSCNGSRMEKSGVVESVDGENVITVNLPADMILDEVTAEIDVPMKQDEVIFMNGYQTWTYCHEQDRNGKTIGVRQIPGFLTKKYAFDRYGDYHFVDYPKEKGCFVGESWCYFRHQNLYRLFASIDEHNGYTVFSYNSAEQKLYLKRDCSGLKHSGPFEAFQLYLKNGNEEEVFDGWFAAQKVKTLTDKKIAGYSSWYNRYQKIDEKAIREDLNGCKSILQPGDLFQIDDGWEPYVGDWLNPDSSKFSSMKAMADEIHQAGFKAGLWLAPFVAEKKSALYRDHQDWFLKVNGENWCNGSNWSGFYSLDIDQKEVIDYLKKVFHRVFEEWGFDLVKLDFLYGAAPFGNERETRAGRMYRAMDFLRECAGDHAILGCGVPMMPAFGKVEYCRVSCDVSLDWNDKWFMHHMHRERTSTKQAIETCVARRQLNGRAYLSDPDVFFLRDGNCTLSVEEKDELATLDALLGGVFLTSDDPSSYTDGMKESYQQYRHLREAEDVRLEEDAHSITVHYRLDGRERTVSFAHEQG